VTWSYAGVKWENSAFAYRPRCCPTLRQTVKLQFCLLNCKAWLHVSHRCFPLHTAPTPQKKFWWRLFSYNLALKRADLQFSPRALYNYFHHPIPHPRAYIQLYSSPFFRQPISPITSIAPSTPPSHKVAALKMATVMLVESRFSQWWRDVHIDNENKISSSNSVLRENKYVSLVYIKIDYCAKG
jgi:hypothetical protein